MELSEQEQALFERELDAMVGQAAEGKEPVPIHEQALLAAGKARAEVERVTAAARTDRSVGALSRNVAQLQRKGREVKELEARAAAVAPGVPFTIRRMP
jgi:tRNA U38,U39,U40 pseudouridine synthase TruA